MRITARLSALVGVASLLAAGDARAQTILQLSKIAAPALVTAGDTATFVVILQVFGSGIAQNVTLTDTLPAGTTWSENSASCSINGTTRVMTCAFGSLPAGFQAQITITGATSPANCPAPFVNQASVTSSNSTGAVSPPASITVGCPALRLLATADTERGLPASRLGFQLAVLNEGLGAARDVAFSASLPGGFTWLVSPARNGCAIGAGPLLLCTLGDIPATGGTPVHVRATTTGCGVFTTAMSASTSNGPSAEGMGASRLLPPGDVNGDCSVTVADVFSLINFLFAGGGAPQ